MRLLAEIKLFGETVVPWSTPRSFQGGKPGKARNWVHQKDKRLVAWQDSLRAAHRSQYGLEPFLGPVMLTMVFYRATADPALWGRRWWWPNSAKGGDLTNLAKAAEDAITTYRQRKFMGKGDGRKKVVALEIPGVVENDSQVCDGFTRKRYGPEDGVEIRVYAVEEDE